MSRDIAANYVVPIFFGLLLYLVRLGIKLYEARVQSRIATEKDEAKKAAEEARLARLKSYGEIVEGAVADVEANVVRDLKDPNKPGKWTEVTMRAARDTAREKSQKAAPQLVAALRDETNVDALTDLLIERTLHRNRDGRAPTPVPAAAPAAPADATGEGV